MNNTLLPCPFCGGEAKITARDVEPQGDPWYGKNIQTFVICTNCGACLFDDCFHEGFADEHEATTAWNRRARRILFTRRDEGEYQMNIAGDLVRAFNDGYTQGKADAVVRGEWIAKQKDAEYCEFACSCCDFSAGQTDQYDATEVKQFSEWFKFCPSCGANMTGKSSTKEKLLNK